MDRFIAPYFVCQLGGLIMAAGGIWLIFKQKIYVDKETNEVTQIDIPFFGKFKTNVPALGLFALGLIPLIYPATRDKPEYLRIKGSIASQLRPVSVYAVVEQKVFYNDGGFDLPIPVVRSGDYTPQIIYVAGSNPIFIFEDPINMGQQKQGAVELLQKVIAAHQQPGSRFQPNIQAPGPEF